MGMQDIADVICCRTCAELKIDEQKLQRKHAIRRKIVTNKVVPEESLLAPKNQIKLGEAKPVVKSQESGDGDMNANEVDCKEGPRSGASSADSHVSDISRTASVRVKTAIEVACNQLIEEMKLADRRDLHK